MKNAILMPLFSIVGLCALIGCANSRSELPPDVLPSQISSVSISEEVLINPRINLPGPDNQGSIVGIVEDKREGNFNERILSTFDYKKFILEELHEEFTEQIIQKGVYQLVPSEEAEAEFVLEVQRIELITEHSFLHDRLRKLTPSIHLAVRLIRNPPIEMVKTDMGQVEPADPESHPILYQKTVTSNCKGLPSHLKADYMSEAIFKSAFSAAIKAAVTKLMADNTVSMVGELL